MILSQDYSRHSSSFEFDFAIIDRLQPYKSLDDE